MMISISFLFFALLVSTTMQAQKQTSQQLTMNDAVQRALTHNPDLKAWRYQVQALKSEAKSEMAGYYPTVGLTSDVYQNTGEKNLDSRTELSTKQLVYSFAGPLQKYQRAKNAAQVSELDRIIQSNQTRLETEKSFLDAWLIQEKEKTIAALKTSAQTTFKRQEHKNKLEKLDKDTWLKNVSEYASAAALVSQHEDDVLIAYKKLEFLMGESLTLIPTNSDDSKAASAPHVQLVWQCKKKYTHEPLDTYYHYALTARPEIPRGLKKMAIEKWNIKLAQGQRLPEIRTYADVGVNTNPNDSITFVPTTAPEIAGPGSSKASAIKPFWSLGVSLSWSIFDGLVQQYKEQQAQADKVKEMLRHERDILQIKQDVREKYFLLEKSLKQLNAQKIEYLRGDNRFKLMKKKLALGKIAQADFDVAITIWQKVQFNWLSYNVRVAQAECALMWACGYPKLDKNNQQLTTAQ